MRLEKEKRKKKEKIRKKRGWGRIGRAIEKSNVNNQNEK